MMYPDCPGECDIKLIEAKRAIELAEQEAEERMRAKAVESDCENFDIKINVFIDGWGQITSDIEELGIVKKERPKMIIIDINNR